MAKSKKAAPKKAAKKTAPKKPLKKYTGGEEAIVQGDEALTNSENFEGLTEHEKVADVVHNKSSI